MSNSPENVRERLVLQSFQGVWKWNFALEWVQWEYKCRKKSYFLMHFTLYSVTP